MSSAPGLFSGEIPPEAEKQMNMKPASSSSTTSNVHEPTSGGAISSSNLLDEALINQLTEMEASLYSCHFSNEQFDKYFTKDATFEDPLGKLALPLAFEGLKAIFHFIEWEKIENIPNLGGIKITEIHPDRIIFNIKAKYQLRSIESLNLNLPTIPFSSKTTAYFQQPIVNSNVLPKIKHQTDEWLGIPLMTEDKFGWIGKLAAWRREQTGALEAQFIKSMENVSTTSSGTTSSVGSTTSSQTTAETSSSGTSKRF